MSSTLADLGHLAGLNAPILCFDTCSILDIIRDPTRDNVRAHERVVALRLLSAMETRTELTGLVADQVHLEFAEHVSGIQDEAASALHRLSRQLARIEEVAGVFGQARRTDLSQLEGHVMRSRAVVDRLMDMAVTASQSPAVASLALRRLNLPRTPARKGKDSMKDCVVIETYLDIVAMLRGGGLRAKVVFVSSNTKDYAGVTGSALKPDAAEDFASVGMEYAPNLAAAVHLLGL